MSRELASHKVLFSGNSFKIGQIHWYLLKAHIELKRKSYVENKESSDKLLPTEKLRDRLTDFGREVGGDEIHWWVFKKERNIKELQTRTQTVLNAVQKLKEESQKLKKGTFPESYEKLISKIKEFTETHAREIEELYDYAVWLNKKDILAPSMLFSHRVWGSTRRSDRRKGVNKGNIDSPDINLLTEIALGLSIRGRYVLYSVYSDISYDIYESDPEHYSSEGITVPQEELIMRTSREVLDELAIYFEMLRNSLRNIILEINKYTAQTELLPKESFWRSFIAKAIGSSRVESQLWDFKETLEMWRAEGKIKEEARIKFCEQIASFANAEGGVIVVGISNARKIVGVDELENKIKSTKTILGKYVDYNGSYADFQEVILKDNEGNERNCLRIAIAQTKGVVSVKDETGKYSYPVRQGTGLDRTSRDRIEDLKRGVHHDNYDFILKLQSFIND